MSYDSLLNILRLLCILFTESPNLLCLPVRLSAFFVVETTEQVSIEFGFERDRYMKLSVVFNFQLLKPLQIAEIQMFSFPRRLALETSLTCSFI